MAADKFNKTALDLYGVNAFRSRLTKKDKADRRAALSQLYAEEVARRTREGNWARRSAYMHFLCEAGFRPLAARIVPHAPVDTSKPILVAPGEVDTLKDRIFGNDGEGTYRYIATFL